MIKLELQPYCNSCRFFDPEKSSCVDYNADDNSFSYYPVSYTAVRCQYCRRCKLIYEYLENKFYQDGYMKVIYAKWENGKCSECGAEAMAKKVRNDDGKESFQQVVTQYCPHCGAHMEGHWYKGELCAQE